MSISTFEQQIYNCHLKHFRNGGGWKPRKDFSDISDSVKLNLSKLNHFFAKFKHISPDDFFAAPRILHPEEPTPSLKFFTTRAAIKTYTLSQKQKINQSPEKQLDNIKKGLEFIIKFCLEKQISLEEYILFKEDHNFVWLEHYRTYQINPYCLMEILDFTQLSNMTQDAIWEPNLVDHFFAFRNRYHLSSQVKTLIKEATSKIRLLLKNNIQKN